MLKWILTIATGVVALGYIGSASYYDVGSLKAITVLGLFMVAFGMALALSFIERPSGRKNHEVSPSKFRLESKR